MLKDYFFLSLFITTFLLSTLFGHEYFNNSAHSVSGDTMVLVGNPGNQPYIRKDYLLWGTPQNIGAVDHVYKIGKYEATIGDWQKLLRAVASQPDNYEQIDAYNLWNEGMKAWITRKLEYDQNQENTCSYTYEITKPEFENLPITYVSLYSVLYYINWKEHGSPILEAGDDVDAVLKHGAYEFFGLEEAVEMGVAHVAIIPNNRSHFYLPSEDEWIKAAYYNSNQLGGWYSIYPTQHDNAPSYYGDVTNLANYNYWGSCLVPKLTPVDYFGGSKSYYGAYDMGGNVNEWTYSLSDRHDFIIRGGSYETDYNYTTNNDLMLTCIPKSANPCIESATIGFRIAERACVDDGVPSFKEKLSDIIDRIKANGVGWSSAETYSAYIAMKNIYFCCMPKKITKNYPWTLPSNYTQEEVEQIRSQAGLATDVVQEAFLSGKNPGDPMVHTVEMDSGHYYFNRTIGIPVAERHIGRSSEEIRHAIQVDRNIANREDLVRIYGENGVEMLRENKWLVSGALEVPKQLICGGLAALVIGAACEYGGKYLGEGIGYLAGGTQGAVVGERIGEDVGAVLGMILPFVIFV